MTGFVDIDGSDVMAGSPDLMTCAESELREILGEYQHKSALFRIASLDVATLTEPAAAICVERAKSALALVEQALSIVKAGTSVERHRQPGVMTWGEFITAIDSLGVKRTDELWYLDLHPWDATSIKIHRDEDSGVAIT